MDSSGRGSIERGLRSTNTKRTPISVCDILVDVFPTAYRKQ